MAADAGTARRPRGFRPTTRSLHTTPLSVDSDSVVSSRSCVAPFGMLRQDFLAGEIVQPTLSAVADGTQQAGSSPLADCAFTDTGPRPDLLRGDHACSPQVIVVAGDSFGNPQARDTLVGEGQPRTRA